MPPIPRDPSFDSTLALPLDGYAFIMKRQARLQSDLFETRLLLQKTICMSGAEAARLFYDNERFVRKGAMPRRIQLTLIGRGGVQGLDGDAHRARKRLFMALMTPESIARLLALTAAEWGRALPSWEQRRRVVLFDELQPILCRAACRWAGVPLLEEEVGRRTAEMAAMIDGAGGIGLRHWRARRARRRAEAWARTRIEAIRADRLPAEPESAAARIAAHRDPRGKLLPSQIAAVELLNIVRPIVAVARFITFAALALHEHPVERERLARDDAYLEQFVHEVRRYYPFFPFAAARTARAFEWKGYRFPKGRRVLLDLYGTNHDPRLWPEPDVFRPERFAGWKGDPFTLIPQGGGNYYANHRCAGEQITVQLMKLAVRLLVTKIAYNVPRQDLRVRLSRIPTLPSSRFVIEGVRRL